MNSGLLLKALFDGLTQGFLYALVALGFILIYKTSRIFNFAQGALCLWGSLALAKLIEQGLSFWAAVIMAGLLMACAGFSIPNYVLRPLLNRSADSLFMATIGLSIMIEGLAQLMWGAGVYQLDLGISNKPLDGLPILLSHFDLLVIGLTLALIIGLGFLFNRTKLGLALRACADNPEAAQASGISLRRCSTMGWIMASIVSLIGGILWGSIIGIQHSLVLIMLKVMAILLAGGLSSMSGTLLAAIGIGMLEKLIEVVCGTYLNIYGTESFTPFLLAMLILLVRPQGLASKTI